MEMTNKHYTNSGREISYYGYNVSPVIDNDIKTLDELFTKLLLSYSIDTTYPLCKNDYNYDTNPTYGQCAITSLIVQDIFGGTIHKTKVNGITHYFNIVDNHYIDLTKDQFNEDINYEQNEQVDRSYCLENEDTKKRYELLLKNLTRL